MVLLNASNSHLFWKDKDPMPLDGLHAPRLLAFPRDGEPIAAARGRLVDLVAGAAGNSPDDDPLAKVLDVGEPIHYDSFWDHGKGREVIPVGGKRPYWMPDISDALFYDHGFYTAEHDIPYIERAVADLCAERDWWMWDTKGRKQQLDVLTYDIETTQYASGKKEVPIDMIGWSDFRVEYEASKDLDTESFDFRFHDLPQDWAEREVEQRIARNLDEEMDLLMEFTQHAVRYDITAGHNVLGFDNLQIRERIRTFLQRDEKDQVLSKGTKDWYNEFVNVYSRRDRSFHFGQSSDVCVWHPVTLDTFHAARKFYFFHDDFTLKGLAPWLGIDVPGRVYMEPDHMNLEDPKTLEYNKHDVQEQLGITQVLIAQALPLAFTVNMPLDSLLTGGNTKMWDHMSFLRARRRRKIMPATCRAQGIAHAIHRHVGKDFPTREEVAAAALAIPEDERQSAKEFIRVAKQGPEMPFWCEHPGVIVRPGAPKENPHGYAIVGGLTLKPDSDLKSHFTPWYHVVEADVGAMYPTILKARNLTADTVQPAKIDETPDDWIWLMDVDPGFAKSGRYHVRQATEDDDFTGGRGWLIGVKHNPDAGTVNQAMTGILHTIQQVKDARAEAKRSGASKDEIRILDMTYASLKAARNAGTHGILVAVNVSCRQFNVWGGANITTIGQQVLHDTRRDFEKQGIRVVYGDTDGIYLGCSKSAGNLPHLAEGLGADVEPEADKWITLPDAAVGAVQAANDKWRKLLDYDDFELEAEQYDAMVFVVHKNYLKFKAKGDGVALETKGNNFKGSDKAPLAQRLLAPIMQQALRDVASWDDEEDGRERMKTAIKRATGEVVKGLKLDDIGQQDIVLTQKVAPIRTYKPNADGSLSTFAVRTAAIEHLLGEKITAARKFKFIVCKDPLPLYHHPQEQEKVRMHLANQGYNLTVKKPRKASIKPIEYMWPAEKVEDHMIDFQWYKDMVEAYIKGAFGFDSLELAVQRDLSSWF